MTLTLCNEESTYYYPNVWYFFPFLTVLMKEPVLQDKRSEHVKFCKYSSQLIEQVCGRPQNHNTDVSFLSPSYLVV